RGLEIAADSTIWVGGRGGAARSSDAGANWEHVAGGLPATDVGAIRCDDASDRLLATSTSSGQIFESSDAGRTWRVAASSRMPIKSFAVMRGRLLAATAFDGLVAQPRGEAEVPARARNTGGGRL